MRRCAAGHEDLYEIQSIETAYKVIGNLTAHRAGPSPLPALSQ